MTPEQTPDILASLPARDAPVTLRHHAFDGGAMLYDAACIGTPDISLFSEAGRQPVSSGGRNAAWYVDGDFGQAVLRHYRRGGLVAKLVRRSYAWTGAEQTRAFAELRLLAWMHGQGLAVPRPLAAVYWRRGLVYQAAILIERIPNVRTLAQELPGATELIARQTAKALHAMHQAGVWHADLNAHNILLDGEQAWVIDFDRGTRSVTPLAQQQRLANLQRLRRSMCKLAQERGEACWRQIQAAYSGYCAEN